MARLPTFLDLSGPESGRSGRIIAQYDTSAAGRGLEALGAGIQSAAASLQAKEKEEERRQDALDITRAEAYKDEGLLNVANAFDHDPDYATYSKRAPGQTGEVVKKAGDLIRNPRARELWLAKAGGDAAQANDRIRDKGVATQRAAEVVAFDEALEVNRRIYVDPDSPDDARAKAKQDIEASISMGEEVGLLDPVEAEKRRQVFIQDAEFSRGKLAVERDPTIITKPLPKTMGERASTAMGFFQSRGWSKHQAAGIVGNLLAESSLNTGARNAGDGTDGSDSIGIGQWNSDRAKALKAYAAMNHADWRDFGIQLAFVDHELRNAEKGAGDKLRAAGDITSATEAMIMYERPAGSQHGAKSAHNYSGRVKFAHQAAGEKENPDWYKNISPEQRQAIDQLAETRSNQISVEQRAIVETATTNAPTAVMNTGTYSGSMPTPEQFVQAYGPYEGPDRYDNFVAAMDTAEKAYSMQTMSATDIQQMVTEAAPTSSGDDAAIEQKRYTALSGAAEATLKAREADPAKYVRQAFPAVDTAWDNVQASPENYAQAVAISTAAQEQLGITEIKPLPKDATEYAVTKFKDPNLPETERLGAISTAIMSTPDPDQQRMIFEQLVDAGLPDLTEGAFGALSRGDTGAARRLFQAAMIDPSKLPGKAPETPETINGEIQSQLMSEGQVGDIFYGLTDGSAENFTRAERDTKLISNAVNLRLREGEDLDTAIAGVSKDLYGDVQVVDGDGRVNVQALVPTSADPNAIVDGLAAVMPEVQAAVTASMPIVSAGPTSKPSGQVEAGNIDLENRPQVKNADGSISTVRSTSFNIDGTEVLIPTVSDDGKILSNEDALLLYKKTGKHLGKFETPDDATAYAEALHEAQERFYKGRADGTKAILDATTQNYIDNVMGEGYFRSSGDGYVFIDPYTGTAIAGPDGSPLIFHPKTVPASVGDTGASQRLIDENAARQKVFQ